jgi:hypothetical protein
MVDVAEVKELYDIPHLHEAPNVKVRKGQALHKRENALNRRCFAVLWHDL